MSGQQPAAAGRRLPLVPPAAAGRTKGVAGGRAAPVLPRPPSQSLITLTAPSTIGTASASATSADGPGKLRWASGGRGGYNTPGRVGRVTPPRADAVGRTVANLKGGRLSPHRLPANNRKGGPSANTVDLAGLSEFGDLKMRYIGADYVGGGGASDRSRAPLSPDATSGKPLVKQAASAVLKEVSSLQSSEPEGEYLEMNAPQQPSRLPTSDDLLYENLAPVTPKPPPRPPKPSWSRNSAALLQRPGDKCLYPRVVLPTDQVAAHRLAEPESSAAAAAASAAAEDHYSEIPSDHVSSAPLRAATPPPLPADRSRNTSGVGEISDAAPIYECPPHPRPLDDTLSLHCPTATYDVPPHSSPTHKPRPSSSASTTLAPLSSNVESSKLSSSETARLSYEWEKFSIVSAVLSSDSGRSTHPSGASSVSVEDVDHYLVPDGESRWGFTSPLGRQLSAATGNCGSCASLPDVTTTCNGGGGSSGDWSDGGQRSIDSDPGQRAGGDQSQLPLAPAHAWYRPLPRATAELVLSARQDGAFLVRPATGHVSPYALSVMVANRCRHLPIRRRADGRLALGVAKREERSFASLLELVAYHRREPVTFKAGGATRLTWHPVGDIV